MTYNGHIQRALFDLLDNLGRRKFSKIDNAFRKEPPELPEGRSNNCCPHRAIVTDAQFCCGSVAGLARFGERGIGLEQDAGCVFAQNLANSRERQSSLVTVKKRVAHLKLQVPDLTAQRRLSNAQPPRSLRDVERLGDCHEIAQVSQFQAPSAYAWQA